MSEFLTIGEPIALFGSEEVDKSVNTLHKSEKIPLASLLLIACMKIKLGQIIFLKRLTFGQLFN
jgi:hypothetical protein